MARKTRESMKVTNNFRKVFRCGYCDLQHVFHGVEPNYYNCGVYGWNCDMYVNYEYDMIITTGYRNMRGERIPSDIISKYEKKAIAILGDTSNTDFVSKQKALIKNRHKFFEELASC